MPADERILNRLPSLYRPEPGVDESDLLWQLIRAVGGELDQINQLSSEVMEAHWFAYADSAIYSPWMSRDRARRKQPPMKLKNPEIDAFPYLHDLPKIASLVGLSPWREPLRDRESVEFFRQRVRHIIRLYRDGVGTLRALRTMTRASLPMLDPEAPPGLRERNFTVEEFSATSSRTEMARQPGSPVDRVGPLMRWVVNNNALNSCQPTVIIQGIEPVAELEDPTHEPIIERFDPASGTGIGLHYHGDLSPSQALALIPTNQCWLAGPDGLLRSDTQASIGVTLPSIASGPWQATSQDSPVRCSAQTEDGFLWLVLGDDPDSSQLWRGDGDGWHSVAGDLPRIHCLHAEGGTLWLGLATGLTSLAIQPSGDWHFDPPLDELDGPAVTDLTRARDGTFWAATSQGAARVEGRDLVFTALGDRPETQSPLRCVHADQDGSLFFGGDLGLILYRPRQQRWFYLAREGVDEGHQDWELLDLAQGELPDPEQVELPPVNAILRGPEQGIWLGTERGIACYRAHEQRRALSTLLVAWPQLTRSAVHQIRKDPRGRLWFATDEGLFLYDQLDWFHGPDPGLTRLPRQEKDAREPVFWRFQRSGNQWQSYQPPAIGGFINDNAESLISAAAPVRHLLWTNSYRASLGSFDADSGRFTADPDAEPAALGVRYKPEATRIVDGGLPGLPPLPKGASHWRYLQREPDSIPEPRIAPAWTCEGRLLPMPENADAPWEGRYLADALKAAGDSVFAFNPAARVWFFWHPPQPLAVTIRLATVTADETIDPIILDRVWASCERVRPAGIQLTLAVNEIIKRGT